MDTKSPVRRFSDILVDDHLSQVVRSFILLMQGVYRTQAPGRFRWDPNPDETDIFISGQEPEEGEPKHTKPRIVIARMGARFMGVSRDQLMVPTLGQGPKVYSDMVSCPVSLRFSSLEGLEAQALAWISTRMIFAFRADLAKRGNLQRIGTNSMQISTESAKNGGVARGSPPQYKTVTLTVPVEFQMTVRVDDSDFYPTVRQYLFQS